VLVFIYVYEITGVLSAVSTKYENVYYVGRDRVRSTTYTDVVNSR